MKDIVLNKLVEEGLIDQDDANEFGERCQVLVYQGNWFSKWFKKNVQTATGKDAHIDSYYMRIIEMREKEDEVDRLLRRTTGDYEK